MPAWGALTEHGRLLLGEMPGWIQEDPSLRAVIHCIARESERIETQAAEVRDGFIPARATTLGMSWHEVIVGAPVAPSGETLEERRTRVLLHYRRRERDPSGATWQDRVTALVGAGWTYVEDHALYRLTITAPIPAEQTAVMRDLIRPFTPAHLDLIVQSSGGFLLDRSQLDQQAFHPA